MKILVDGTIFETYPNGGIARIFREVLPRLCESSQPVEIVVLCSRRARDAVPTHKRISTIAYGAPSWMPARVAGRYLRLSRQWAVAASRKMAIDVFLPTYYTVSPLQGPKTVALAYDLIDHELPLFAPNGPGFVERQRKSLQAADRVVAISNETMQLASRAFGLRSDKLSVAYPGTSSAFVPQPVASQSSFRTKHTNGSPFFLFVGSADHYKNLGILFRGFARSIARRDHILVLAGHSVDTLDTHFQQLALELGIERQVVRLPRLDDCELAVAYSASTAFVFPSVQEGFGIPLLEAMRCQTKVIASDIAVFHEVCGDEVVYFSPHDEKVLAELLDESSRDSEPCNYTLASKFSWNETARVVFDACLAVTAGTRDHVG